MAAGLVTWTVERLREGGRSHHLGTDAIGGGEYTIYGDGIPSMRWSLFTPDETDTMHRTLREAKAEAERYAAGRAAAIGLEEAAAKEKSDALDAAYVALAVWSKLDREYTGDSRPWPAGDALAAALRAMLPATDPQPWIEHETARRLTQAEVDDGNKRGRCWLGLAYEPRMVAS